MKSPITGKEMKLIKEPRSMEFRKENFEIIFHYFKCEDSGEQFTTTALDEINLNQLYNQYRAKFNIPFPDEISRIREQYSLPASKMSEILGFGINTYRQYEAGEIPSIANANLIQLASNPEVFIGMINQNLNIDSKLKTKYINQAQKILEERKQKINELYLKEYFLGKPMSDIYSGYRQANFEKFTEMIVFFAEKLSPFKTKMNKLLFYADFLMFKQTCFSISGVKYVAIDRGPVPNNFQSIYEYLINKTEIDTISEKFADDVFGERFVIAKNRKFNSELFSDEELKVLNDVANKFKTASSNDIIKTSHLEKAWQHNSQNKSLISYKYAFDLNWD